MRSGGLHRWTFNTNVTKSKKGEATQATKRDASILFCSALLCLNTPPLLLSVLPRPPC